MLTAVKNRNLKVGGGEFEASFKDTGNVPWVYVVCVDSADLVVPTDFLGDHLQLVKRGNREFPAEYAE